MMIEIKEGWHMRRYVYLADSEEKALEMYREDIKYDPHNPSNWKREANKDTPAIEQKPQP